MEQEFLPSRAFVLSELPGAREKEMYYKLLLDNGAKFFQDEHGNYIASVRMLAPGVKKADPHAKNEHMLQKSLLLPYEERMTTLAKSGYVSVEVAGENQFNYSPYPRFVTLIADTGDTVKPKTRILSWVMKIIEDIYDARFAQEKADDEDEEDGVKKKKGKVEKEKGKGNKRKEDESVHMKVFPVFVVRRLSLTLGLKKVVDQSCWDLLANIDKYRKDYLEVEVFARFLTEFYDYQDLIFFLYVRSVVANVLHISFKTKWTRPDHGGGGNSRNVTALWMSYRECMQVSKIVFGEEGEPMMREFINLLLPHMVGQRTETSDTRRIDITQFMHLAVVKYHQTQTQDATDAGSEGAAAATPAVVFTSAANNPALAITAGGASKAKAGKKGSTAITISQGEDLSGSTAGPTLAGLAAGIDEEMAQEQEIRQREFLDYICEPLEDYLESGALTDSDTNGILQSLYDSLKGHVDVQVSRANFSNVDEYETILLKILRDDSLRERMEKERDRLVMLASGSG